MAFLLLIETATDCCSVAIAKNSEVLLQKIKPQGFEHAALLPTFVAQCLNACTLTLNDMAAIAVSNGPGSYTGLRVGLSYAKALCFANNIPLITIPTLELMTCAMIKATNGKKGNYLPMLDARRMEVFTAIYNEDVEIVEEPFAAIINIDFLNKIKNIGHCYIGGNGALKAQGILVANNIFFNHDLICKAEYMAPLANNKLLKNDIADLAYCEPFYLKNFNERI